MAKTSTRATQTADRAADLYAAARENPYVQRLIEDEDLRDNLRKTFEAARGAYNRATSNGKSPVNAVTNDKKVQKDLRSAAESLREASEQLRAPKKRKSRLGRLILIAMVAAALALIFSEDARKTVLDTLFGAEEEFEYTSTTSINGGSMADSNAAPADQAPGTASDRSRLLRERATLVDVRRPPGRAPRARQFESAIYPPGLHRLVTRMEAATKERELNSEKAQRIVDAMRESVARRGAAGSTFEQVAAEAGVSRGLLHYYFGTKERLLVEVVRRDAEIRITRLDERLAEAKSVDDVIDVLLASLTDMIENEPAFFLLLYELFSAGRRNPDIRREVGQLFERTRSHVAEVLKAKEREGVLNLRYDAEAVVSYLFAVGDGFALQALSDPERDNSRRFRRRRRLGPLPPRQRVTPGTARSAASYP